MSLEHSPARRGKKTRVSRSSRANKAGVERNSFTLREFALRHGLSDSALFALMRQSRGPKLMLIGNRGKRVSLQAELAWIAAREAEAAQKALRAKETETA